MARASMAANMCQTWIRPLQKRNASKSETTATKLSAAIITLRRSQRSMSAPANGPIRTLGRMATNVAVARIVAEPVDSVNHQTSANWASRLPIREKACPDHTVKNGSFQLAGR